jgi:hypothetical protein
VQLSSRSHVKASLAKLAYNFLDTVGLHFYYKRLKCQQFKIWEVVQRLDGKMMRERERERDYSIRGKISSTQVQREKVM